jgi:ribulose-5-phosphate 4-epimerase/fuculose-1-phosphate aldolase
VIPEIPFYIGAIADVPYLMPGSTDLAAAVTEAMATHDLAQLRHHGQVVAGTDPNDVIQKARFFELACEIVLHGGDSVRPLSESDIARLQGKGIGA